ncbi:MAG TPA: NAD-dependent epimerase/dehydratase family protein [Acidimicrobiales bacterium]|nr:NAD-dependent epimerase/dehydratase family protein [Acidimicrobiales bacterium]
MGRRVLVTGADTFWGGRVIQALENDRDIEVLLGLGTRVPTVTFERAEFVRADQTYSILSRIVHATQVDTVIHTFMIVDSTQASSKTIHEVNVIGTMNLLAAASAPESSVRQLVVKSSGLVYGSSEKDPATFSEDTPRERSPRTDVERSLVEAESLVRDFAEDNPSAVVALLRFANVLGDDIVTAISRNLSRAVCPCIFGFDPLVQFVHEDDVVRALEFVTQHRLPGTYNVAGAGRLPWSEVAAICGTRLLPLPPVRPSLAVMPLVRLGLFGFPPELDALLRYGRGMDTSRLVSAGFEYRYTSAGAVQSFARHRRLRRAAGRSASPYVYEHDVEQFFLHSPSVVRTTAP